MTPDERRELIRKRKEELMKKGIEPMVAEAMAIGEVDSGVVRPINYGIGIIKY